MNNSPEHSKVFRAEKTTKNRDDFKVLMVGLMIGIFLLLVLPVYQQVNDQYVRERPFVRATVKVVQTKNYERPMILYDADSTLKSVQGTWIATIHDTNGNRIATRRGTGNYTNKEDNPRLWTWTAFFEQTDGAETPDVPEQPFYVCVRYVAVTLTTSVVDDSPDYCSVIYHPEYNSTDIVGE
jgi:hypothetical protein